MILVYSHTTSARLQYITHFIFAELMGQDMRLTIDSEEFQNADAVKINYSQLDIPGESINIQPAALLFEDDIREQPLDLFELDGGKAFFRNAGQGYPFDIFAASFYLLSRYEEYLPHKKDMYGRYAHENSLAFKEGFLDIPLINTWVKNLAVVLQEKYSIFNVQFPVFSFEPTYDIDIAYSYKYKGLVRNMGGLFRSTINLQLSTAFKRFRVLTNLKTDPFDSYHWLIGLQQQYNLQPIYFFLVPEKNGQYDKNILPHKDAMWELVKQHAKKYRVGLHPSWQSGDRLSLIKTEKEQLESMADAVITRSRQHYIRFSLPQGYRRLIESGIANDHSMGYGSINGFRASVANEFYWFDLSTNEQTMLRIHPFCYMEANSFYEQKFTAQQAYEEMLHYYNQCKNVNGTFSCIWHNHFLGTDPLYAGWKEVYERFLAFVNTEQEAKNA